MSDCTQCADYEWCAKNEECGMFTPKTMTNAMKIRSLSDEELATFIDEFWSSPWCPDEPPINTDTLECLMHDGDCKLCILDWLRQEVSDAER